MQDSFHQQYHVFQTPEISVAGELVRYRLAHVRCGPMKDRDVSKHLSFQDTCRFDNKKTGRFFRKLLVDENSLFGHGFDSQVVFGGPTKPRLLGGLFTRQEASTILSDSCSGGPRLVTGKWTLEKVWTLSTSAQIANVSLMFILVL